MSRDDDDDQTPAGRGATWGIPDDFLTSIDRCADKAAEQIESVLQFFPGTNGLADVAVRTEMRTAAAALRRLQRLIRVAQLAPVRGRHSQR